MESSQMSTYIRNSLHEETFVQCYRILFDIYYLKTGEILIMSEGLEQSKLLESCSIYVVNQHTVLIIPVNYDI